VIVTTGGRRQTPQSFENDVIKAIRRLRPGDVASYGEIAEEAGYPRAARAVGAVLSRSEGLPWWRIVRADGRLVAPHQKEQGRLLRREGISVVNGRIVRPPPTR
jgi:methylated-DNA-protein-cysteine methyltransferase-like protein